MGEVAGNQAAEYEKISQKTGAKQPAAVGRKTEKNQDQKDRSGQTRPEMQHKWRRRARRRDGEEREGEWK